jgi:hypothetical protein
MRGLVRAPDSVRVRVKSIFSGQGALESTVNLNGVAFVAAAPTGMSGYADVLG